jgi:hypothetical protein
MNDPGNQTDNPQFIDRKSFILGMITAFAECVANECKRAAFSPPFYPEDYTSLLAETRRIAEDNGVFIWYEKNLDIPRKTRLNWFVIYKFPEVFDEYRALREKAYNPAWHLDKFTNFLSYGVVWGVGDDNVIAQIRETRETRPTYARILLKPGAWPIENR